MRLHAWIDRPNLYVKIPATKPGLRRDRGLHRARQEHQRDADLLAAALPRGRRGVPARPRAARRRRRRPGRRSTPSRASSSRGSTPRPTSGSTRSARSRRSSCAASSRVANAKLAYEHYREAFSGPRWEFLAGKGANPQRLPLGVHVDEEPGLPRRDLRRGADRPGHGEHDAARRRSAPSRITARCAATPCWRTWRRRTSCCEKLAKAGVDYDDVTETLELEGVQKFADSFDELLDGIEREARRARAASLTIERARAHRPDLGARPDRLDRRRRGAWLGWLDEPRRMRERRAELRRVRRRRSRDDGLDAVVLLGMGGSSLAPEVLRRTFGADALPRARHDAPAGDPRARGDARPRAHAVRLRVEVGLDARDALAHRLLLGEDRHAAASGSSRSPTRARRSSALARERGFRRCLRRRADDRRPLLGAVAVRDRPGRAAGRRRRRGCSPRAERDGGGVPARRGQPRLELGRAFGAGWQEGRDKICIADDAGRLRPVGRAADRRVDRQARQGARSRAGRVAGRARPAGARGAADRRPVRARQEFFRWEFATAVAGVDPRDQPVRPAGRAGGEGQDERGARDRATTRARAARARSTSCSRRRAPATTSASRPSSTRRRRTTARIAALVRSLAARDRLRRHARLRPALPALDRPAAQGRPEHRALPPGRRRPGRRAGDPRQAVRLRAG